MKKVGVEYRCIIWRFKNRPHIYTFWRKIFMDSRQFFCIMILGFSPCFYMRIMQSENSATNIHTHYRQSETAPIYAHYTREKFRPDIYEKSWRGWNLCARLIGCWCLCVRFVSCFVYGVIVWISSFLLLIGWCQNLIVKAWWDCINSL